MYEHHIENGEVTKGVLNPKLIVTISRMACRCKYCTGSDQREYRTCKEPEVCDIKQSLRLADNGVAAEDDWPTAYSDGEMIYCIWCECLNAYQTPEI